MDYLEKAYKWFYGQNLLWYEDKNAIVYYPSILITNPDRGTNHKITDVYVKISKDNQVSIGRTSYTIDEAKVGYKHSHCERNTLADLSPMCTGTTTPIRIAYGYMKYDNYSENSCMAYIIELNRALHVESEDGGAYIYMREISESEIKSEPIQIQPISISANASKWRYGETEFLPQFVCYYLSHGLNQYSFDGRAMQLDITDSDFIKRVSEIYMNFKHKDRDLLCNALYKDGMFYYCGSTKDNARFPSRTAWSIPNLGTMKITYNELPITKECIKILRPYYIGIIYSIETTIINYIYKDGIPCSENQWRRRYRESLIKLLSILSGKDRRLDIYVPF